MKLLTSVEVLVPVRLKFQDCLKDSEHFYMDMLEHWDCTLRAMDHAHSAS